MHKILNLLSVFSAESEIMTREIHSAWLLFLAMKQKRKFKKLFSRPIFFVVGLEHKSQLVKRLRGNTVRQIFL